jgi:glycosyl hydrolase family 16
LTNNLNTWQITEQGQGTVTQSDSSLRLTLPAVDDSGYHNAQISDYSKDRLFNLRPPLKMTITASASHSGDKLRGTAGFGFWNHPFAPNETRFDIPQALWFFFSSPPSKMALAKDMPTNGWKAATFNAKRLPFFALLPTAPLAIPLMNIPPFYDALWSIGQDAIGVSEAPLDSNLLAEPHTYSLDWQVDKVIFAVDGEVVLEASQAIPKNALGFVAWLDNQYAIVSPKGQFGFGLVDVPQAQSLILHQIELRR